MLTKGKHNIDYYLEKIPKNNHSIFLTPTSETEITKLIKSLKCKNSSGHDGISNKVLKGITEGISEPLCIYKSMEEGKFPSEMKKADTVPLHKSKARDDKNYYKPISLLLIISKLLEKVMYTRTYNFLTKYDQIYSSQYRFRKSHSCQDAIAELIGEISRNTDECLYTTGVFLDLTKAFDTPLVLDCFKSYLHDTKMRVKCMVTTSPKQEFSEYNSLWHPTRFLPGSSIIHDFQQ